MQGQQMDTCAAGRRLRSQNLARSQSQTIPERRHGRTGRLASCSRAAQHLGICTPRGVLEICGATETGGRQTRLFYSKGQ